MNRESKGGLMRRMKGLMLKTMHGMITCREFEAFIIEYLSDELPPKQRKKFEWHIKLCRECREYLEAYRTSMEISKLESKYGTDIHQDDVPEDLIKAILASKTE